MVAAVATMEAAPPPLRSAPGLGERLSALRVRMDDLANCHCHAQQGVGTAPDLSPLLSCISEAEAMLGRLSLEDSMQANFMIGCGWHMLGNAERAFNPLMEVCKAPDGAMEPSNQLSAILIALPMLRSRRMWAVISRICDRAKALGSGNWPHFTVPYMKGLALASLNRPSHAAELFEQAIGMNPGWSIAYVEFDKAATALRDFERCRRMAQRLVDHGGHWVNAWQRPDHFLTDFPMLSQPWHDARNFPLAKLLEDNFVVIRKELEALEESNFQWGTVGSSDRGNENSAHDSDLVTSGDWSEIVLLGDTPKCAEHCRRCPETARLLKSCPEAADCASMQLGEALFSRLKPGTSLRPHCGPTNMRLTCHLGLAVPDGCTITCGGETRTWAEGKCIVFDDSFEHEVQHVGTGPRKVLLVNFWHPDVPRDRWRELTDRLRGGKPSRPAATAAEPCAGLFAAVRAAGGLVSERLVRGAAEPGGVPGLLAAADIEEGEELCRVPGALRLSPGALRGKLGEMERKLEEVEELPAARRPEVLQAAFLCQLLQGAEQRRLELAAGVGQPPAGFEALTWEVWERWADVLLGEDFAFHPYRRAISETELLRSLSPSPEADFFAERARELQALHQATLKAFLPEEEERLPLEMFVRARLCMLTRSFRAGGDSTLVPVIDLFNHGQGSSRGVVWRWDEAAQVMVVTATRKIKAGEELLCAYGARSNLLLYRTYGFTHPPDIEPSWSYIVRPKLVSSVYDKFLPGHASGTQVVLDSNNLDSSLCEALNAATRAGGDAGDFLRSLCKACLEPYEGDERLRPVVEALRRAREKDRASPEWWSELGQADRCLVAEEAIRVKMCEYLCLLAHLEALELSEGAIEKEKCLRGTGHLMESLGEALRILREERRDVAVELAVLG